MKAVVGVDIEGHYVSALNLFARLGFTSPCADLVHTEDVPLIAGAGVAPYAYVSYAEVEEGLRRRGEELLSRAVSEACARGIEATSSFFTGNAAQVLMAQADGLNANLIVVGSHRRSKYGAFFLGSVGRGITIGANQSILIAKTPFDETGGLKAVFATDCSPYADACLRQLVRMAPSGIKELTLVTAVEADVDELPPIEIVDHMESLVRQLAKDGICATSHILKGDPSAVVDEAMRSAKADLLILGAQGHGFIERLFVGSFSLHEVVATPHSVLLLRTPASP